MSLQLTMGWFIDEFTCLSPSYANMWINPGSLKHYANYILLSHCFLCCILLLLMNCYYEWYLYLNIDKFYTRYVMLLIIQRTKLDKNGTSCCFIFAVNMFAYHCFCWIFLLSLLLSNVLNVIGGLLLLDFVKIVYKLNLHTKLCDLAYSFLSLTNYHRYYFYFSMIYVASKLLSLYEWDVYLSLDGFHSNKLITYVTLLISLRTLTLK